jgi:hypothetical protein
MENMVDELRVGARWSCKMEPHCGKWGAGSGRGQDILGGWSIFLGTGGGGIKRISGEARTMGWGRKGWEVCKMAGLCSCGEQP